MLVHENQEHLIPNTNTNTLELSHHQQNMSMINVQLNQQNLQNAQLEHDMLSSLRSGLRVITEGLDDNSFHFASSSSATRGVKTEVINDSRFLANANSSIIMGNTSFVGTEFSPTTSFHVSPAASGTSYFSVSPQGGIEDHFGVSQNFHNPNSESDQINTNSATNNAPNLDFPFGHVDDQFDPNFTFGHPGFY